MTPTPFTFDGPITQQRAEAATEWMVHNAARLARAKGDRDRNEHMLKVVKSLAMKASDEKSAASQERDAYASEEYRIALDALFRATVEHEELLATRMAAQAVIEVWRSLNSNLKGARV